MIGDDSLFEDSQSFMIAFYPCNQAYEDAIESSVTCVADSVQNLIDNGQ
jgi:hypothetical protein